MPTETCILTGLLFAVGLWLMLQRSVVRILFGFIILSNAANLFLLMMSGNPAGRGAPIIEGGIEAVDPLPQALVLTAIVIAFGITAYLVTLLYRLFLDAGTTAADELYGKEPMDREGPR